MVSSLLNASIYVVANNLLSYDSNLADLPSNIKVKLLRILTKRGLLTVQNLAPCLHHNIRELELVDCDLNDKCLNLIAETCKYLIKIDLNGIKNVQHAISSQAVQQLAMKCIYLQVIYLRRCVNIKDECVQAIATSCTQLRELNLSGCINITDSSLYVIGEKSCNLESLNLSLTKISDDGVYALVSGRPRNSLKELNLSQCNNITDASIEAVVECCKNITILPFTDCPLLTDRSREALDDLFNNNRNFKQVMWTIY